MAILGGRAVGVSSFPSSSYFSRNVKSTSSAFPLQMACTSAALRGCIACSAVQETSTSAVAAETKEAKPVEKEAPVKPKPPPRAAKAPAKPLPELMEEEVIPSLKAILEAQDDLSNIELCFKDNKLEGSFMKGGNNYSFWAFFPEWSLDRYDFVVAIWDIELALLYQVMAATLKSCWFGQDQKGFHYHPMAQEQARLSHFSLMRRKSRQDMLSSGLKSAWLLKEYFLCGKNDHV